MTNYVFGDLETSDSNVNSLSVLEASFCLYDDRFREIGTPFHATARIKPTCVPSLGAVITNNISVAKLKGANWSSFDLTCAIYKTLEEWKEFCMIHKHIFILKFIFALFFSLQSIVNFFLN